MMFACSDPNSLRINFTPRLKNRALKNNSPGSLDVTCLGDLVRMTTDEAIAEISDELHEALKLAVKHPRCTPIGLTARQAIKMLGWELFGLTRDLARMRDILHTVAKRARQPRVVSIRGSICDIAWNGIGDERRQWWN